MTDEEYIRRNAPEKPSNLLRGMIHNRPSLDTERVLAQIYAGDIRCSRAAARELASEAEDAYGDAFEGSPADVLRRQAKAKGVTLNPNT